MAESLQLQGRVFIQFDLHTVTGLHIGGSETAIEIGGVDKTVIRNPLSGQPYIPGSSLRGKMRSLTEKHLGLEQNWPIAKVNIHSCRPDEGEYQNCKVCRTYGVAAEVGFNTPTRLIVRDTFLAPESAVKLTSSAETDLPYTEVKTEVAIDRVTSVATPRQMERVPAGAIFGPGTMVYSIYYGPRCDPAQDVELLATVFDGMQLLEDDYLGGLGSRGSGQVRFANLRIGYKHQSAYGAEPVWLTEQPLADLAALGQQRAEILGRLASIFKR